MTTTQLTADMDRFTDESPEFVALFEKPWARVLIPDREDGGWLASILELPGCRTDGRTPNEAMENLDEALAGYLLTLLNDDLEIPVPVKERELSGRLMLRIPPTLHTLASMRAEVEGVSLNRVLSDAIARHVGQEFGAAPESPNERARDANIH